MGRTRGDKTIYICPFVCLSSFSNVSHHYEIDGWGEFSQNPARISMSARGEKKNPTVFSCGQASVPAPEEIYPVNSSQRPWWDSRKHSAVLVASEDMINCRWWKGACSALTELCLKTGWLLSWYSRHMGKATYEDLQLQNQDIIYIYFSIFYKWLNSLNLNVCSEVLQQEHTARGKDQNQQDCWGRWERIILFCNYLKRQKHKKNLPKLATAICRWIYVSDAAEHWEG